MSLLGLQHKASPRASIPTDYHSIIVWEPDRVCAAVLSLADGAAEILGVAAVPLAGVNLSAPPDVDRWTAACEKALSQAEDMTSLYAGRKIVPDYVTMSMPADLIHDVPVVNTQRRRDPERGVTLDELRAGLRRGYRMAQDIVANRHAATAGEIVWGSVSSVRLGGQIVRDPLRVAGEALELSMNFCLAPLDWVRALEIVANRLQLALTHLIPDHVVLASLAPEPSALSVLLDKRQSRISLARYGRLEWAGVAELGATTMLEAVTSPIHMDGRQAEALLRAYRGGQLRQEIETALARTFWQELRRWMLALADAARTGMRESPLPHRVYFRDLTRSIPEAAPALETPFWEEALPFERCPEIVPMDGSVIREVMDATRQTGDASYLLLRALAHQVAVMFATPSVLDRSLAEIIRWRQTPFAAMRSR